MSKYHSRANEQSAGKVIDLSEVKNGLPVRKKFCLA